MSSTPEVPPPVSSVKLDEVRVILEITKSLSDSTLRARLEQAALELQDLVNQARKLGVDTSKGQELLGRVEKVTRKTLNKAVPVMEKEIARLGEAVLVKRRARGEQKDRLSAQIAKISGEIRTKFAPPELFETTDQVSDRDQFSAALDKLTGKLSEPDASLDAIESELELVGRGVTELAQEWKRKIDALGEVVDSTMRLPKNMHHRLVTEIEGDWLLEPKQASDLVARADSALQALLKQTIDADGCTRQLGGIDKELGQLRSVSKEPSASEALSEFRTALDVLTKDNKTGSTEVLTQISLLRVREVEAQWLYDARRYEDTLKSLDGLIDSVKRFAASMEEAVAAWKARLPEIMQAIAEAGDQADTLDGEAFSTAAAELRKRAEALQATPPPGGLVLAGQELDRILLALADNRERSAKWSSGVLGEKRTAETKKVQDAAAAARAQVEDLTKYLDTEVRNVPAGVAPPLFEWTPELPQELDKAIADVEKRWDEVYANALALSALDSTVYVTEIEAIGTRATKRDEAVSHERLIRRSETAEKAYALAIERCDALHTFGVSTKKNRGLADEARDALDKAWARSSLEEYELATKMAQGVADVAYLDLKEQELLLAEWLGEFRKSLDAAEVQLVALDKKRGKKSGADTYRTALGDFAKAAPAARYVTLRGFYDGRVAYIMSLVAAELGSSSSSSTGLKSLGDRIKALQGWVKLHFKKQLTEEGSELRSKLESLAARVKKEGSSSDTEQAFEALTDKFNALLMKETNLLRCIDSCKVLTGEVAVSLKTLEKTYQFDKGYPKLWASLSGKLQGAEGQIDGEPFEALQKLAALKTEVAQVLTRAQSTGEGRATDLEQLQGLESEARLAEERKAEETAELSARQQRLQARYDSQELAKDTELEKMLDAAKKTLKAGDLETTRSHLDMIEQRLKVRDKIGADPSIDIGALTKTLEVWRKSVLDYESELKAIATHLGKHSALVEAGCAVALQDAVLALSGRFDPGSFDRPVRIVQTPGVTPAGRLEGREEALSRISSYRDMLKMDARFRELDDCPFGAPEFRSPAALYRTMANLERVFLMAVTS